MVPVGLACGRSPARQGLYRLQWPPVSPRRSYPVALWRLGTQLGRSSQNLGQPAANRRSPPRRSLCCARRSARPLQDAALPPQNAVYRFKFNALHLGLVAQSEVEASFNEELASRLDLLGSASSTILASAFMRYSAMHPVVKAKTLAKLGVKGNAPHLDFGRMCDSVGGVSQIVDEAIDLLEGLDNLLHKSCKNCANQIMTITPWNAVKQVAVDKPHLAYRHPATRPVLTGCTTPSSCICHSGL